MTVHDVVVVGGGPVGGQVARLFAKRGFDVVLAEEHPRVGEPVQCAGLFTPRIFELVDFPMSEVYRHAIHGAHVWSPKGHCITLDGGQTMAVAIDRAGFDQRCVESAAKAGADVRLRTKVTAAAYAPEGGVNVTFRGPHGETTERARLVVGADGVQSSVAKWFDLPRAREILPCYGSQMEGLALNPGYVEMFVGEEQAPGFFSWMIPTDDEGKTGKVEVGVGYKSPRPAKHYYDRMFTDPISKKFITPEARSCFDICGCIPLGPLKRTTADRVMLVGDAAAHAKPTSGGGVYTGLKCAAHLVDVATDALERDELGDRVLKSYHDRVEADIGRELWVGNRLRKAFMNLSDDQVEKLFRILDDPETLAIVNQMGDIDYPSRLASKLLVKKPELFQFSGAVVRSLFS
ncbi:MAG TPA: NAD(P)/FAD-dependent oxidoreductase [Candidatus Thermoplasmatota archaeon]|nr:NAD(P)/FAD-dependent oxidoreductase [Candidatus Thermoplasmatota archaeon]